MVITTSLSQSTGSYSMILYFTSLRGTKATVPPPCATQLHSAVNTFTPKGLQVSEHASQISVRFWQLHLYTPPQGNLK